MNIALRRELRSTERHRSLHMAQSILLIVLWDYAQVHGG